MLIEGQFPVAAPPEALMRHLFDAGLVASCLPGCEALEPLDENRYRAVVVVGMAGINARFDLNVEVTHREALEIRAVTRGEEGGNASTLQAETRVFLQPGDASTLVAYRSEVALTGRLGRFALGMMKKKAQNLGDEFAANLRQRLQDATPEAAPDAVMPEAPQPQSDSPTGTLSYSFPRAEPAAPPSFPPVAPPRRHPLRARWRALWSRLRGLTPPAPHGGP